MSRSYDLHFIFFPEEGTIFLEDLIRFLLSRLKNGMLNYNPLCAYAYELLPRLVEVYRTQILHLLKERDVIEDEAQKELNIEDELTLQESEIRITTNMIDVLDTCFVLRSAAKP